LLVRDQRDDCFFKRLATGFLDHSAGDGAELRIGWFLLSEGDER